MKSCANCGKQIDDGLAFCPYCGAQQPQQQQSQPQQPKQAAKGSIILKIIPIICLVAIVIAYGARQAAEDRLRENISNSLTSPTDPVSEGIRETIRLMGTWVNEGANEMSITYTFSTGGVGSQVMSFSSEPLTSVDFTWKVLDTGLLQLEANGETVVVEYSISSDGKTLSLPYWNENKMDTFIKQ